MFVAGGGGGGGGGGTAIYNEKEEIKMVKLKMETGKVDKITKSYFYMLLNRGKNRIIVLVN